MKNSKNKSSGTKINFIYGKTKKDQVRTAGEPTTTRANLPADVTDALKEVQLIRKGNLRKTSWWEVRGEL